MPNDKSYRKKIFSAMLTFGQILMFIIGGFIMWAVIEAGSVLWIAISGIKLSDAQLMAVFLNAIQAGVCGLLLRGVSAINALFKTALANAD